ncbi:hypothetical protein B0T16DRAFT_449213 [Cercophora newfieldiana]|uniref:SH3 domain-containing protein n=1 Tax=Cercophora newfieldiana TaxID=92897 RepID=A0AA39XY24_9PEZI|nr:hypothetical protein B0T16DRAFT_449213 [Cercophora newfieldiana]
MPWIPRNILSTAARHDEDANIDANIPDDESGQIEDEWLLVDSNGESTPASQLNPEPEPSSNPTVTASVDITIGRTSNGTAPPSNLDKASDDNSTSSSPTPIARTTTRTIATTTCKLNPYLYDRGKRRVLYDFMAAESNELSVMAGEDILLLNVDGEPEGWLVAENSVGQVGWVPRAYVQDIGGDIADAARSIAELTAGGVLADSVCSGGRGRRSPEAAARIPPAFADTWTCKLKRLEPGLDDDDDW